MPTYEYKCEICGVVHEEIHRMSNYPFATTCDECGGCAVKILSLVAIHGDESAWVRDEKVTGSIVPPESNVKIESRTDLKRFLKANPNIEPIG